MRKLTTTAALVAASMLGVAPTAALARHGADDGPAHHRQHAHHRHHHHRAEAASHRDGADDGPRHDAGDDHGGR